MSELILKEISNTIGVSKKYNSMIDNIEKNIDKTTIDSEHVNRGSSQLKTVTLDITDLTEISSAKHILASITNTRIALEETGVILKRKTIEKKIKQQELINSSDLDAELIKVDIEEIDISIKNIEFSARAAIRKLSHLINQYNKILDSLGVDHISEELYEKDQIRYHILTAFYQALTAARARGGIIDEGNHIYLFQLGINGSVAQAEVTALLEAEGRLLSQGMAPSHEMVMNWLNECANKYIDNVTKYIEYRNFNVIDKTAIIESGEDSYEDS